MDPFKFAQDIQFRLEAAGHEAYLAGGFVRDVKLGREPSDIDIATAATPDEIAALFPNSERVGAKFGVTLVKGDGIAIEVATFRLDGAYKDSRRPESVEFTRDWREDVKRRDFTINGMFVDWRGKVLDGVFGMRDIENRLIRAIGDPNARFQEDALRMMRAVRFAVTRNLRIEDEPRTRGISTLEAIQINAPLIRKISSERIREELDKILMSGKADKGIALLLKVGLLDHILPEVAEMVGVPQNPKHHPEGDVWVHTLRLLAGLKEGCSITLALAALLHDVGKPGTIGWKEDQPTFYEHEELGARMTVAILHRLKYPNELVMTVRNMVAEHMRFRLVEEMRRSKLLRFVGQNNFDELLELHRLDAMAGRGNLEHYDAVKKLLAEVPPEVIKPVPLITGHDLIEMGFKPGPAFKEVLHEVETGQLEGGLRTREEARAFAATWLTIGEVGKAAVEG